MRILVFTRYDRLGASSRLRFLQYFQLLHDSGIELIHFPLLGDDYLQDLYSGRSIRHYVIPRYLRRIQQSLQAVRYDAVWLEKEVLPYLPAIVERTWHLFGIPYVVDYDDAIFHNYDLSSNVLVRMLLGRKIDVVMAKAHVVVAGNKYLAARAYASGAVNVVRIPTVVDLDRYPAAVHQSHSAYITVGWVGTFSTLPYLLPLLSVFRELTQRYPVRFVVIGVSPDVVNGWPVTAIPWSESDEVTQLQQLDVGIMPLPDEPWAQGKCGYKLIQYMACSKPVIASPVGVNAEIVKDGYNGLLATSPQEWKASILHLLNNPHKRQQFGINGRKMVEDLYSLQSQAPRMVDVIRSITGHS